MIPRSLFHKSRIGIAKHMLCTGRKTTKLLKPFHECTRTQENFVLSHSVRFYTYSLQKAVWSNKYVTVGNKQIDKCLCEGQRGIKTKVNSSALSLQQQVTPLTTKRSRKKTLTKESEGMKKVVVAYAMAEETDLENLQPVIEKQGLYRMSKRLDDMTDILHLTAKYKAGDDQLLKEFFIFREGSVVCWNVPELERLEMIKLLLKNTEEPYRLSLVTDEHESMEFTFTQNESNLVDDRIMIKDTEQEINLDKYAFSNALSQSVKLSIWESTLDKFIDSIEFISEELRTGKKISLTRQEALRKLGEIFALRHSINLSSDLLDTPDFYWDRDKLELLFQKSCNHLSIARRTKVMNEKLNHCCELMELIDNKVNDARHVRLEWMIIILIMVEVCFELAKYVERFILAKTDDDHS